MSEQQLRRLTSDLHMHMHPCSHTCEVRLSDSDNPGTRTCVWQWHGNLSPPDLAMSVTAQLRSASVSRQRKGGRTMGGKGSNCPPTERQDFSNQTPWATVPSTPSDSCPGWQASHWSEGPRSLSQPFVPDGLSSRVDLGCHSGHLPMQHT